MSSLIDRTIAVIGLGYVGLPLAVEFAKKRAVLGFDVNAARVEELSAGFDKTLECSPEQLRSASMLTFSSDESALDDCGVFIVTVPTPVDSANRPDLTPLERASETVGRHLGRGDVVVFESTVFPGPPRRCVFLSLSARAASPTTWIFLRLQPERINPGDKTHTLTTITKIVSGGTIETLDAVDALILAYTGTIYYDHYSWMDLLVCLRMFHDAGTDVKLILVGQNHDFFLKSASRLGVRELLVYHELVSAKEAAAIQRSADCLIFFTWKNAEGIRTSKLAEYVESRRPILMLGSPTDIAEEIENLGVGVI